MDKIKSGNAKIIKYHILLYRALFVIIILYIVILFCIVANNKNYLKILLLIMEFIAIGILCAIKIIFELKNNSKVLQDKKNIPSNISKKVH